MFPGTANNIATPGDKSDFVAEAPSHHKSSAASHSRLYVPRGSSRLGESEEHSTPTPAAEPEHAKEPETVEGSALDAEIAQLKADRAALEQSNADLMTQIETLAAETSAQDALKKCRATCTTCRRRRRRSRTSRQARGGDR